MKSIEKSAFCGQLSYPNKRRGKKTSEAVQREVARENALSTLAPLGCVFTQTKCDAEGYAIRGPASTTYVGAIETAEEFGKRLYWRKS